MSGANCNIISLSDTSIAQFHFQNCYLFIVYDKILCISHIQKIATWPQNLELDILAISEALQSTLGALRAIKRSLKTSCVL